MKHSHALLLGIASLGLCSTLALGGPFDGLKAPQVKIPPPDTSGVQQNANAAVQNAQQQANTASSNAQAQAMTFKNKGKSVLVTPSANGPLYTVKNAKGQITANHLTADQLKQKDPQTYQWVTSEVAKRQQASTK